MTIRHLKVLIAVADCGKMSLAAEKLFIAQPTVSQAVSEIEQHYGVKLFERLSRKLYLTPDGERLLGYARHIVASFEEMELELQYAGQHPYLKIGATITVGACILPGLLGYFEAQCTPCVADAYIDNTRVIEEMLLKSELDIGLVEGRVKSPDLIARPVMEDELVLVCAPEHPLAGRESVRAEELQNQSFILREPGSGTRELFEQYLSDTGVTIHKKWICHSAEAIKNAVIGGQGLSVLSRRLVCEEVQKKKLCQIPFSDVRLTRPFCLIYHKNKFISPAIRRFLDCTWRYVSGEDNVIVT